MRKLLIVVDMQKDFIDGSLGTAEAQAIVEPLIELVKEYKPEDIIATRDTHPENYLETLEGRNLPVVHCVKDTEGWQIDSRVQQAMGDAMIVDKPTFGSCQLADMVAEMAQQEELEITLCGLCTDICVVSNALLLKARLPETRIRVAANCCAGVTPESHTAALTTMQMCQIELLYTIKNTFGRMS